MRQKFSYEVVDPQGRKIVGSEEARDRESLLVVLQSRGMHLLRWLDEDQSRKQLFKRDSRGLKPGDRLEFTKELAHLSKSGMPLDRALAVVADSASVDSVRATATYLKESLRGGHSLSEAMASRPQDFHDLYVNMVRVGEMGGVLDQALEKLARFMERTEEIKRFVISSSIYPAILLSVGVLSVFVILGFVIPRFADIFADMGQEIPLSTRVLISVSDLFRGWWWLLLLAGGLLVFGIWRYAGTTRGKQRMDRLVIRLPLLGGLISDIQVSRFARTLGTLVLSGVPVLKALAIVREVVANSVIKEAVEHIYRNVRQGRRVSILMKETGVFPSMVVHMTSVGEEAGDMGEMLVLIADDLDKRIQEKIKSCLSLLEPIAILLMGLIIGGMVLSMLSAIFGIHEIEF
jgi:type II secretory pathway component PulF